MITYFKNQRALADAIKKLIDDYWALELPESKMVKTLNLIYENNKDMIIRDGNITAIIKQRLGKKRLDLLMKVLNNQRFEDNQ